MKVKNLFLLSCASAAVILSACGKDDNPLTATDKAYMTQAAYSNLAEIDASQLALTKGQKDSVKMFGTMMIADHQKAYATLDSLAKVKGVAIPTTPDSLHMAMKTKLMALSGRSFDTAYMNNQVKDHLNTINLFQSELTNGSDQNVRDYSNKFLPNIQMHYQMATAIATKL